MSRQPPARPDGRSSALALLVVAGFLAGCPAEVAPPAPDAGCDPATSTCACDRPSDCGAITVWTCLQSTCARLCRNNDECPGNRTCDEGVCRTALCAEDADCDAVDQCLEGRCGPKVTAAAVASCLVLPARAVVRSGTDTSFHVVTRDAAGVGVPYRGAVTWSSGGAGGASTMSANGTRATLRTTDYDGPVEVNANIGSVTCDAAFAQSYGEPDGPGVRVVVADSMSFRPIPNVKVVVKAPGLERSADTDARGVALLDVPAEVVKFDLHAFAKLHAWVSYVGIRERDLVVFAKPFPFRNGFTGSMSTQDFEGLAVSGETARFALFGSSIPANLLDLQTATFFGDLHPTDARFGQTEANILLPSGVVFGVADEMFRETYDIFAPPGVRTAWGLGGNTSFSELFSALAPLLLGDGRVDTGELLARLLPLVNRMQHGLVAGRRTPFSSDLDPITIPLDAALRLKVRASLPALPGYRRGALERRTEGAFLVAVADVPAQGLVPLGLTAGLDGSNADGKVTAGEPGLADGTLSLRLAPRRHGLEGSPVKLISVAASFSRLGLGGDRDPDAPLVFSALVHPLDGLRAGDGLDVTIGPDFLQIPSDLSLVDRTFTRAAPAAGSHYTRLDVGNAWRGEWSVWLPDDVDEWSFPAPPEGFDDRLHPPVPDPDEPVEALVQSVRLVDAPTFEALVRFDGVDPEALGGRLSALSTRQVPITRSP